MKNLALPIHLLFLLLVSIFFNCSSSRKQTGVTVNPNASPEQVMQTIFDAAKNKDFKLLKFLLPPEGMGNCDGDCKALCNPGNESMKQGLAHNYITTDEFIKFFSNAKIIGKAEVMEYTARVKFTFGENNELDEVMNLQKIEGKWYLESF